MNDIHMHDDNHIHMHGFGLGLGLDLNLIRSEFEVEIVCEPAARWPRVQVAIDRRGLTELNGAVRRGAG
jgi:hypothetical protein